MSFTSGLVAVDLLRGVPTYRRPGSGADELTSEAVAVTVWVIGAVIATRDWRFGTRWRSAHPATPLQSGSPPEPLCSATARGL